MTYHTKEDEIRLFKRIEGTSRRLDNEIKSMLEFKKIYFPKEYKKYEEANESERLEIEIKECQEELDYLKQKRIELNERVKNK